MLSRATGELREREGGRERELYERRHKLTDRCCGVCRVTELDNAPATGQTVIGCLHLGKLHVACKFAQTGTRERHTNETHNANNDNMNIANAPNFL